MKPFFASGHTKSEFINLYFDEKFKKKRLDSDLEGFKKPSIFEKYILIDPDKSRGYTFWEMVLLLACTSEFLLVPYVIGCTDITKTSDMTNYIFFYNVVVDAIWVINIFVCFVTAFKDQLELIKNPKTLAIAYLK
jgi:hypothetical protein